MKISKKIYWQRVLFIGIYFFIILLISDNFKSNFINLAISTAVLVIGAEFIKNKIN